MFTFLFGIIYDIRCFDSIGYVCILWSTNAWLQFRNIMSNKMFSCSVLVLFTVCILWKPLGYRTEYYTYLCHTQARDIWLGIVLGYKALLQIAALFIAFGNRKVKVRGLDDSQSITAAIYVSSIALVVIIIANVTINDYVNLFACIFATGILVITSVILGMVFMPLVCVFVCVCVCVCLCV